MNISGNINNIANPIQFIEESLLENTERMDEAERSPSQQISLNQRLVDYPLLDPRAIRLILPDEDTLKAAISPDNLGNKELNHTIKNELITRIHNTLSFFIKNLEHCEHQISQLKEIKEDLNKSDKGTFSRIPYKDRIVDVLKTIPQEELDRLKFLLRKSPILKNIFSLAEIYKDVEDVTLQRSVVDKLLRIGEIDRAIQVANLISYESDKRFALASVTVKLLEIGELNRAFELAKSFPSQEIAVKFLRIGEIDRAIQVANLISFEHQRNQTLFTVIEVLLEIGEIERALEVAHSIPTASVKSYALDLIIKELLKIGEIERAFELVLLIPERDLKKLLQKNKPDPDRSFEPINLTPERYLRKLRLLIENFVY